MNEREQDFTKPITVHELEKFIFKIIPNEKIDSIELFKNNEKISLYKIEEDGIKCYSSIVGVEFKDIGIFEIKLTINGIISKQKIRALPIKISLDEYKKILEDVRVEIYNLAFNIFGKSSEEVRLASVLGQKSIPEYLIFFRRNFELFQKVFKSIAKDPEQGLTVRRKVADILDVDLFSDVIDFEINIESNIPIERELGFLPTKVSSYETILTYNVYENRLLKHFIGNMINTVCFIETSTQNELRLQEDRFFLADSGKFIDIIEECQVYKRKLVNMLNNNFLADASSVGVIKTSMVLQRAPKYKAFYKLFQEYRQNYLLQIDSEYFHIPIKQAWHLYEIWAFLKTFKALQKIGFIPLVALFSTSSEISHFVRKTGLSFELKENVPLLKYEGKNVKAFVYYQRFYPKVQSVNSNIALVSAIPFNKIPDIVIEVFREDKNCPDVIVLDAKYRIDQSLESALKDMSHYAQTICSIDGTKVVESAHIIYPGSVSQTFASNTGYIGLLPSTGAGQFELKISDLLSKFLVA